MSVVVDVCLESYGLVAHALDVGVVDSALSFRRRRSPAGVPPSTTLPGSPARTIRELAALLPFPLLQALWLVDMCGCSYATAAAEAQTTPAEMGRRVAEARRTLATQMADITITEAGPPDGARSSIAPKPPDPPLS